MTTDFINTPSQLQTFCQRIATAPWIALDTEFVREKHYYADLCLIQVATDKAIACIDPLALDDLGPLEAVLFDPAIVKVFHAARQDLEIFHDRYGRLPAPVFDTQIAATLAGLGEQLGYAALVSKLLGVHLDKGHARTDWRQRPLAPEQLRYAADDVRYLGQAFTHLHDRLDTNGRLAWLDEEFATLVNPETYANPPRRMWERIKGAGRLKGVQLAVLQALAAWREEQARERNRPRRWILKDEVLLDLARLRPDSAAALGRIRGLDNGVIQHSGERLIALIRDAAAAPESEWPRLPKAHPLDEAEQALLDSLMAILRLAAREAGVSPASLASRRELERLLRGDRSLSVLKGWRRGLAGDRLVGWLAGEWTLRVADGRLSLVPPGESPTPAE